LYFYGFIHSLTHSLQTSKNFCFYLFGTDNAVAQRESMCLWESESIEFFSFKHIVIFQHMQSCTMTQCVCVCEIDR